MNNSNNGHALIINNVPCDGCTLCCHKDRVRLLPADDETQYKTEPHPYLPEARMLAHKPNGDCYYLGEGGCTIQTTKPQMCREMDCCILANNITYTRARKLAKAGELPMPVYWRGVELLKTLGEQWHGTDSSPYGFGD